MSNFNYQNLKVWQKSIKLASSVYRLTATLPAEEKFGLISQMRRAAVSIPSNIAEGSKRGTDKEFRRFLQNLDEIMKILTVFRKRLTDDIGSTL